MYNHVQLQLWQVKSDTWHKGLHHAVCSPCSPLYVQCMCYIQLYLSDDKTRTHHSQGSKGAGKNEWGLDPPILLMCTIFVNCVYLRCDLSICWDAYGSIVQIRCSALHHWCPFVALSPMASVGFHLPQLYIIVQ